VSEVRDLRAIELRIIDRALLDGLSAAARGSPRGRKNLNFHADDAAPSHRLLNAIEPGSYVAPHRHLDPHKDETFTVVRGRLGLVAFDEQGAVVRALVLAPDSDAIGATVPAGTFHSVVGLVPGTIFFESKAGPYVPITPEERAPWAPAEGAPEAAAYYQELVRRLEG
jgi:cupin fold WbuC family metalloprotein